MEAANATKENQLFNNISSTTIAKPAGFDNVSANTQVSRLNGAVAGNRVGPSIILKVMPGDIISVSTKAWYTGTPQAPVSGLPAIKDQLLPLLTNGIAGANGTHGGAVPQTDINNGATGILNDFLNNQPYNSNQPKAFLNWMIVDEDFKKTTSSLHNGSVQVPIINAGDIYATLVGLTNLTVRKGGWLYVYVSNESNQYVYFDDLVVNHKRGPVVETNDYYAFGLEIPGISSKALGFGGGNDNRRKYNAGSELQSKEFSDGSGLEMYDTHFRQLDPQTGRWWQIDPKPDFAQSPYSAMNNNPVSFNDPLGDVVDVERDKNSVSRKEFRQFKRDIRDMRRNSESFNKMYKDMKNSDARFVFKANNNNNNVSGGRTDAGWKSGQDGVTTMNISTKMSSEKEIGTIAHEGGHGWRIAQGLDAQPGKLAAPSMPAGVFATKQDWNNYNKQNDFVNGQNNISQANANEAAEVGAMHIENIVVSELKSSGNTAFGSLQFSTEYTGANAIKAVSSTSLYGNPTYKLDTYQTYNNIVPLSYYNNKIDIHKEFGVQPID